MKSTRRRIPRTFWLFLTMETLLNFFFFYSLHKIKFFLNNPPVMSCWWLHLFKVRLLFIFLLLPASPTHNIIIFRCRLVVCLFILFYFFFFFSSSKKKRVDLLIVVSATISNPKLHTSFDAPGATVRSLLLLLLLFFIFILFFFICRLKERKKHKIFF